MDNMCKMIVNLTLIFVVILNVGFHTTQGCQCQPNHPQQSFCQADFVIKGRVKGVKTIYTKTQVKQEDGTTTTERWPFQQMYHMRISKIFKDSPAFKNTTQRHLYTSASESMCGTDLKNNTKYVIEGRVIDGKAFVSVCDVAQDWNTVPIRQRKGYNYMYEKNCKCKVSLCWTANCMTEKNKDPEGCKWNFREDKNRCYSKHSMCMMREGGYCQWSRTNLLKDCLAKEKSENSQPLIKQMN